MSTDHNEANRAVVQEFRANGGAVGGWLAGVDLLILHHVGAKSGNPYETPLARFPGLSDDGWAVIGTNGGSTRNPDWVHNLLAAPDTVVEMPDGTGGVMTVPIRARCAEGEERQAMVGVISAGDDTARELLARITWRIVPIVLLKPVQDQ